MEMLGWVIAVVAVIATVATFVLGRNKASAIEKERDAEKSRADQAAAAAARLPDAQERAARAEARANELTDLLRDATARQASTEARHSEVAAARDRLEGELSGANARAYELATELEAARVSAARAASSLSSIEAQLVEARDQLQQTLAAAEDLRQKGQSAENRAIMMEEQRNAALDQVTQVKSFLETAKEQLKDSIGEVAGRVFEERTTAMTQRLDAAGEASKLTLESAVKPLLEKVGVFQERVEQFSSEHVRDQATLVGAINNLQSLNQNMAESTDALTKALKGNAKVRGDWGEMVLESVLKASGLEQGLHYLRQENLKDDETSQRRRPDVIVQLPDGRQVVVDSKVNLVAWHDMTNAATPEEAESALLRHTAALRAHMRDLAEKNYPKVLGSNALEMTVMFVPIEGALSAALSTNRDLQEEAFAKGVALCTPNTLNAMLKVIDRLWARDKVQRQIDLISAEAGKMMDSVVAFLAEFKKVEDQVTKLDDAVREARRKLSDSSQSVMSRARRMAESGAKGRKTLPEELAPAGSTLQLGFEANGEADEEAGEEAASPA